MWGGGGMAGGWSHGGPGGGRLRSAVDGWDDEELGSFYDHTVVKRVIPYMKPFKIRAIIATISMIIYAVTARGQPLIIGLAIDRVGIGDLHGLAVLSLIFLGMVIVAWAAYYTQLTATGYMGHRILLKLRTELFEHL